MDDDVFFQSTTNIDPATVDAILGNEINRLSFQQRNDIQEEIHGVKSCGREETPELIEEGLRQILEELWKLPSSEKAAWIRAQELAQQHQSKSSYTIMPDFYLRFLRTELWNIKKAAKRLAMFLNLILEVYGEYALQRPIQMADFTEAELKEIKCGQLQLLPFRDRSGRRILAFLSNLGFDMDRKSQVRVSSTCKAICAMLFKNALILEKSFWGSCSHVSNLFLQSKWLLYLSWIASEDLETQHKGIVLLVFPGDNARETFLRLPSAKEIINIKRMQNSFPYRVAAVHCCMPDTPFFRIVRAIIAMNSTDDLRVRMRFSIGRNVEIRYQLLGYGIPVSTIPLTDTGTVKNKHLLQFIMTRRAIEDALSSEDRSQTYWKEFIDCPFSKDVVFRSGTASLVHPGNVNFRELIALYYQQHNQAESTDEKKALSWKIVHLVNATGGRFLEWDRSKGCWTPMLDQSQIRVKVALTLRDFKKVIQVARNSQVIASSTHQFEGQDGRKRRRTGEKVEVEMCGGFCGGFD
jgi:hypothetical protein